MENTKKMQAGIIAHGENLKTLRKQMRLYRALEQNGELNSELGDSVKNSIANTVKKMSDNLQIINAEAKTEKLNND